MDNLPAVDNHSSKYSLLMEMNSVLLPKKSANLKTHLQKLKGKKNHRRAHNMHKTRSARLWDIFAIYILALLMRFSFTVLPYSAGYVQLSPQCTLSVQICGRDTFCEQHTGKKKGNRKSTYWKMSDINCHEVPRKILNLLPDETFCISKNMALFLCVFGREPCF